MHRLKRKNLIYGAITLAATCVFCMTAACAMADEVSLAGLPKPATPFAPTFFSDGATTFPSNGNAYVKAGSGITKTTPGLEGRGPHGGYDTTTNKCGVCHSGHSGGGLGTIDSFSPSNSSGVVNQFLTRAGTTGCEYCHVGSGILASSDKVYTANGGKVDDLGAGNSGHAISGASVTVPASDLGKMTLSCMSCHTVHGVNAHSNWMPTDFWTDNSHKSMDTATYGYKLLRANPGGGAAVPNTDTVTPSDPTAKINDPGADPRVISQFAFSAWCSSCHDKTKSVQAMWAPDMETASTETTFSAPVPNPTVHTTGATLATDSSGKDLPSPHYSTAMGVGAGALQCYTCHRGGGLNAETVPSTASLAQLKSMGYNVNSDAKCSLCHYGTANFATDPAVLDGTSDWPHSSVGDVDLLGAWTVDFTNVSAPVSKSTTITTPDTQEFVCGRCHPMESKIGTTITFSRSLHVLTHSYPINPLTGSWETSTTVGPLGGTYSPGY